MVIVGKTRTQVLELGPRDLEPLHPCCILVDGDATDGDATDGDATDGDATDEDATDVHHPWMRITPGCTSPWTPQDIH